MTRTYYLDTSTLSYAARQVALRAEGHDFGELQTWVREAATAGRLCLSVIHIVELGRDRSEGGESTAAWLDGLPITWMYTFHTIQELEDERLVRIVAGVPGVPVVDPFAASFLSMWRQAWTPELLSEVLPQANLVAAVRAQRERDTSQELVAFPSHHKTLREDREMAERNGVSQEKLKGTLAMNRRAYYRTRAGEAHRRLVDRGDAAYRATGTSWGNVQDPFVQRLTEDERALPTEMVIRAYDEGFERETAKSAPGGRNVAKKHGSSVYDYAHAAGGAAYCDVFTCDEFTARCLGNVRERLGFPPPEFRRKGEPALDFAKRLMEF